MRPCAGHREGSLRPRWGGSSRPCRLGAHGRAREGVRVRAGETTTHVVLPHLAWEAAVHVPATKGRGQI
jgi:hypothetical protein